MLKPSFITLEVKTHQREYNIHWSPIASISQREAEPEIDIYVTTKTQNGNNTVVERFKFLPTDIKIVIKGTKDLEEWFYTDFAYQYADLHANDEETSCLRASILYDLGNYEVVEKVDREGEESIRVSEGDGLEGISEGRGKSQIFYVSMNDDASGVYCFSSYDNAEQWANERLCRDETITTMPGPKPYTIFTVAAPKPFWSEDVDSLDGVERKIQRLRHLLEVEPLDLPSTYPANKTYKLTEEQIRILLTHMFSDN